VYYLIDFLHLMELIGLASERFILSLGIPTLLFPVAAYIPIEIISAINAAAQQHLALVARCNISRTTRLRRANILIAQTRGIYTKRMRHE
jgi:hypothetical protein